MTQFIHFLIKVFNLKLPRDVQKFYKYYRHVCSVIFTLDVSSNITLLVSYPLNKNNNDVLYFDRASPIESVLDFAFGDDGCVREDVDVYDISSRGSERRSFCGLTIYLRSRT